ncbi:MAG TPA: transposase, partial [Candidatus Marinimicrobia bacterium]|nr:transposase [Candidatus Neomarinimicrobiota bacterium]
LLARIAEHKTGKSWASIRREMNRLMIGKFTIDKNTIFQLTELTPAQQEILRRLGIKEPASIVDIQ